MLEHLSTIQDRITGETLSARFEAQAHRTPEATAVVFEDESVTYADLNSRANRLARVLLARGVGVEDVVAIAIPRSIELVVGLFAILKTGACYLPLDPDYSEERTAFMIADAHPALILQAADVRAGASSDLPDWDLDEAELSSPTSSAQAAYLIYTSGTTNRPKGVLVPHAAICNRLRWMQATYHLRADDRVLQKSPSSFDPSVCEFFWPLAEGAALVLARPGGHKDPSYLSRLVRDQQVTTVHFVASMLGLFVTEYARGGSEGPLRRVFSGGEGLSIRTVEHYLDNLDVPLYNQYGPTEAAVDVTYWRCRRVADADLAPLGQPIWNTRIHLLDELLRPVEDGQIGELYIAGAQLARGYANRGGLTAERFVANPLDEAGSRMYRSGDLARRRADGNLEFAGRADDEVKIRGFRIELAEIETVVLGHPLVQQAAVVARPGANGEMQLVGYAVLQGDQPPTPAELRAHVAALLPGHLVPAVFVVLGELPLTVNGKLDRGALPVGVVELVGGRVPRGVRQEVLCGVFGELLGVEGVSVDDDFFVLGGHSLLAARLVSRVRSVLGVELELGRVFEFPTVAGLDSVLAGSVGVARVGLVAGVRPERLPLSFAQQRLWFLDQLDSTGAAYNIPYAFRLNGLPDQGALTAALRDVVLRHEALRTRYVEQDGVSYQEILAEHEVEVEVEFSECIETDLADELERSLHVPFDLGAGVLVRGGVFVVGGGCVLLVVVHHVACDGWSVGPLLADLSLTYAARLAGEAPGWEPLPVQYADYALWQQQLLGDETDPGSVAARELVFWQEQLVGAPAEAALPVDRPRRLQRSGRGGVLRSMLDADTAKALTGLARTAQVTVFMLLQAAFTALLTRIGPSTDIVVGSPVAGRDDQALDDLVGFFVNTIVLRTDTSGDPSFTELLHRVRATALAAYAHQQIPFERVVEKLNPDRATNQHPLFQVMFVLQNNNPAALRLTGLGSAEEPVGRQTAKFDLTLSITEHPDGLDCALEYASDLFEHHTAQLILTRYQQILHHLSTTGLNTTLSALPILTPAEQHHFTHTNTDTDTDSRIDPEAESATIHQRFEHQTTMTPDNTALVFDNQHLTYTELNTRANQLAHWLSNTHHLGRGDIIGICLPRSHHQVISTLAVLKTGASYLQLDPDHPPARLTQLLTHAHAHALITNSSTSLDTETVPCPVLTPTEAELTPQQTHNPTTATTPADPACLMFTSGSTGTPKGVLTPHHALTTTLLNQHFIDFSPEHRWLQCSPVSWDAHALELFGPLLHGATCILQPGQTPDPTHIAALINTHHISTVHLSASLLNHLIDDYPDIFTPVTQLMTGGEAASVPHHRTLLQRHPHLRLINGYSPLENTIFALTHHVQPTDTHHHNIPLGTPLTTKTTLVLDEHLQPTPPGTPGQLYMSGPGLAHGYHHQPALTATHFTANPYGPPGSRLYRTGDLARQHHDGTIHHLGRTDHQTKIRGFRIEPNEVRTTLTNHPDVHQAEVIITTHNNQPQLTAYVTTTTTPDQLHHWCTQHLPHHLQPTTITPITEIPRTPNGKLDHTKLPTPTTQPTTHQPPTTPHHHLLNTLYTELLNTPHTNINDNFFTHGGHSLLAMRLISRIRTTLGVELSVSTIFQAPTVALLAREIEATTTHRPPLVRSVRPSLIPLSHAQQRLWLLDRIHGPNPTYHVPLAYTLTGPLDQPALHQALTYLTTRHEILRTVLPIHDDQPYQHIIDAEQAVVPLTVAPSTEADIHADLRAATLQPFDLESDLPIRAWLFRITTQHHVLLLVLHHIATDGWSTTPLLNDLTHAYTAHHNNHTPHQPPLPVQYADYTLWQHQLLNDTTTPHNLLTTQLTHWSTTLTNLPEEIPLPTDHPRPAIRSQQGRQLAMHLDAELHQALVTLGIENRASLFMVIQAALVTLLHHLGAGTDIPIGTVIAARNDDNLNNLIGFFINTLVLRTNLTHLPPNPTYTQLLHHTRTTNLTAYTNQDLPFDTLVEHLNPTRTITRHPLFQTMLVLQSNAASTAEFDGLELTGIEVPLGAAKFDLTFEFGEDLTESGQPAGLNGTLRYAVDLFEDESAQLIADSFQQLLRSIAHEPALPISQYQVLPPARITQLLGYCTGPSIEFPSDVGLAELFERQVDAAPTATSLLFEDECVSFAELDTRANRLAQHLRTVGIARGDLVALYLPRGPRMVEALLAILKVGAAYLPLDPANPIERIAVIVEESRVAIAVTDAEHSTRLPAGVDTVCLDVAADVIAAMPADRLGVPVTGEELACVLFTSGSTGRPKGVASPHRATARTFFGQSYVDFGAGHTWLQTAPVSWDGLSLELWPALLHGATCVLAAGQSPDPAQISQLVHRHQITTLWLSAGLFATLLDTHPEVFDILKQVMTGGEAPSRSHLERVVTEFPRLRLVHGYGPVESMVFSNAQTVTAADVDGSIPVGAPIANTDVYVLDSQLRLAPAGVPGEVYLSRHGLAHGYLHQPALTAERFVADPHGPAGTRMYRTGDLGRWRHGGALELLGRADDQVKIRGFRIELGEIEAALTRHPDVTQAAVTVQDDPTLGKRLVAYVVFADGRTTSKAELRAHVAALLPGHLVPAVFVVLGELPLTVNGKLDRGALPVGVVELVGGRVPRGVRQEVLCGVFGELLGVEGVSVDDDFFVLGGHSLLAARLVSRVRSVLGVELELGRVFEFPTVAGLDSVLAGSVGVARVGLVAGVRPERLPLSFAQQRLWFLDQLDSTGAAYNVPIALRIAGELDVTAAELALADVLARHEALRTIFPTKDGEPYQLILPVEQARVELAVVTCTDEEDLARSLSEAAGVPFDLGAGVLVRGGVFVVGGGCVLLVVVHHVACDGWSVGPLLADLSLTYAARLAGEAPGWEPLPVQYADYALWQQQLLGDETDPGSVAARELVFWQEQLVGAPAEAALPVDRPRRLQRSGRGGVLRSMLDADTAKALTGLARTAQVTVFMLLQAAFTALLTRIGPSTDIVVGSPVAGRDDQALDDLVGFFVNTIVLRTDTSGDPSFTELLHRVRATALAAYAHQQIPFERVVEKLNPDRATNQHPLFQVMFVLQNNNPAALRLTGLGSAEEPVGRQTAKFDLTLSITEHPDGLDCALEYASDLFEHHTAQLILTRYQQILHHLSTTGLNTTLSALPILTPAEQHHFTHTNTDTDTDSRIDPEAESATIHQRFEHQTTMTPDNTALVFDNQHLTYTELNTRANQLAHWLSNTHHLGRGDIIGICLPRSHHQVISTLAVLKTGASYLQLDPDHPPARLTQLLTHAHAHALITNSSTSLDTETVPCPVLTPTEAELTPQQTHNPTTATTPADPACLMFTSGSTGTPKGVLTPHHALTTTLLNQHFIDFSPEHRWLQCSPVSWDAHALELFGPLLHGATCILQPGQTPDPTHIAALINTHHISTVHLSASLLNHLIDDYPDIFTPVTQLMTGGEAASVPHHRTLLQRHPHLRLINGYSPLENTIFALTHHVQPTDTHHHNIPLGTPLTTKTTLVLDEHLQPTPPGTPGQLYMSGPGLAHGYHHQPALTATHFTANPYGPPGSRLYRTGDLARQHHDGTIHHLGRTDHQTKIRGFRIEPNEVRTTLTNHPDVHQAEVIITTHNNQPQLTAYVTTTTTPDQLHHWCTQHLPHHLQPTTITPITEIPRTPNGKLDHTKLPTPTTQPTTHQPPTTPHHHLLNTLYTELLNTPHTNINDNFFTHGGHSLLAMRLISRIRTTLGVELSIKSVFDNPTVAGLADCIAQAAPARPALKRRATNLETE